MAFKYCAALALLFILTGCDSSPRTRPFGYLRVGPIENYLNDETFDESSALFVRKDESGLSAMSTMCSHDLQKLKIVEQGEGRELFCDLCKSRFSLNGDVISGPASFKLPYFALVADALTVGAPKDTLYAKIGTEVDPSWRLRIHYVEESEVPISGEEQDGR